MHFTKKIDRAFQWAGEKMGGEARTAHSDEFRMLETEMNLRHEGMDRMSKSMGGYMKWMSRRNDHTDDKERGSPISFLGRTMAAHGEEFEPDSEFGTSLLALGRANERIGGIQETYVDCANATWGDNLERSMAMMKEYQAARKKLENRRLAYDASHNKMAKARRDDYRVEEEVRMNKGKFEESSEDVLRRMQDIKESEVDNINALTQFLDAELDYFERCADELRRVRQNWVASTAMRGGSPPASIPSRALSRTSTQQSYQSQRGYDRYAEPEPEPEPARIPTRSPSRRLAPPPPPASTRPVMSRSLTFEGGRSVSATGTPTPIASLRATSTSLSRTQTASTDPNHSGYGRDDVFGDGGSSTRSGSPDNWGERSSSPATSYGSVSRSTVALNKKPPPPPPNRAKKPPPPPPARRENLGY